MKVLVTGGSGFLGRHLVECLRKSGYKDIRILNRSGCEDLQKTGVEVYRGDIANFQQICEAVKGCEAVFHVAAKAGVFGSYISYYKTNVVGTTNVVKACQKYQVRYLIYTSSPSVVFNGHPLVNVDEHTAYGNMSKYLSPYAYTKMLAEKFVLASNGQEGVSTLALRPHLIWGPGDNHLIPSIIKAAQKRCLFQVGEGINWVDISYVKNVAQAHLLALSALKNEGNRVAGKAYFISQGEPVQLWPWINQLLRRLNIPEVRIKIPASFAFCLGSFFELFYKILCLKKQPPMTRFVAKELSQDHYFDISAAKMDLHYVPQISTEEGLEKLVEWLKKQGISKNI